MRIFCVVLCATILGALPALAVQVDGRALLAAGYDPNGIQVIFVEASPSAQTDTAVTDEHGLFDVWLEAGWYQVSYYRYGYAVYDYGLWNLRYNSTLPPVTLMPPLYGRLNGVIGPGDFHVTDSLFVADGETATIVPGTHLYFSRIVPFQVAGQLIAAGSAEDSILFSRRYTTGYQATWRGISFVHADGDNHLEYVVIEHATKGEYQRGGGVYGLHSSVRVMRSTFRYNHGDYGGGVYFESCAPEIESCAFVDNVANGGAGAAFSYAAATVSNCEFLGNAAYYTGGGIYADGDTTVTVTRCRFVGNEAWDGAGASVLQSPVRIDQCVFTENMSARAAGLLFNDAEGALVTRCTLSGNTGPMSSAFSSVAIFGGRPEISTTVISETSVGFGIMMSVAERAFVHHSDIYIVGGDPLGFSGADSAQGPPFIGVLDTVNVRGDTCDAYYNVFLDPEFNDSLAFHLEPSSPCIDTGDPELPYDPDNTVADMGAFYYDPPEAADPRRTTVTQYALLQNYPNPFNSTTQIRFELPRAGQVVLSVFDVNGRLVTRLLSDNVAAGSHSVSFDAGNLTSGMYFYQLQTAEISQTRKMMLLK